ncbi:MAG: hypothetical protein ACU833_09200 [Gammaproteobacteria bacterium]
MTNAFIFGLSYADRLNLASESRHRAIRELFDSDIAPLTSLMGPLSEGPDWPAGASWLAARRGNNACIVSDGLSDPWVERDKPETGLGLEVFIETPDAGVSAHAPLAALADTWLFPMLAEVSHTLAGFPRLCEKLLGGEPLSLEFAIDHIKDGRGRAGALLRILPDAPSGPLMPGGRIQLAAATLLNGFELQFLRGKGAAGRRELAGKLDAAGFGHFSLLHRPSVV